MVNVNRELTELISIYRTEPKRTINPFSMRLQGVIDANVMGGISKYQEAFFSEQFLKSPQGQAQSTTVQKLKTLILEQLQILEMALELHGQLAPTGVQPLHKRLLERFIQLRQNLSGLGKLKRQHSESIVNTPLPPLPIEKRSMSLGNKGEPEDIYTRASSASSSDAQNNSYGNRETLALYDLENSNSFSAPPVPARPKSAGYVSLCDSPEIPPKYGKDKNSPNAPPLPPRGYTPDSKRSSNSIDFDQNRRGGGGLQKYSVVDISLDDSEFDNVLDIPNCDLNFLNDFRDSGISTSSNDLNALNNLNLNSSTSSEMNNIRGHHKTNSNPEALNIHAELNIQTKSITPPPIPPKIGSALYNDLGERISPATSMALSRTNGSTGSGGSGDGYCVPKNNGMEVTDSLDSK